jgi:hypothetical protein
VFIGIGSDTGVGTLSLAVPNLPTFERPNGAQFVWALVIGLTAAVVGSGIRWLAVELRPQVERRAVLLTPIAGLAIALLAIFYAEVTDHATADVLFSGETALPHLINGHTAYTVGALLMLILCKGLAYGVAMSGFRGGPVFPAMFIGAAGGIAMSDLPGMSLVPGVAMGIGAMTVVLLRFPLTSVLLATLLLGADGLATMPLVIVAVVVAFVASAWLVPAPLDEHVAGEGDSAPATTVGAAPPSSGVG